MIDPLVLIRFLDSIASLESKGLSERESFSVRNHSKMLSYLLDVWFCYVIDGLGNLYFSLIGLVKIENLKIFIAMTGAGGGYFNFNTRR